MKHLFAFVFILSTFNFVQAQVKETFYPNGNIKERISYNSDGEYNGVYETYYDNEQIREKGSYNKREEETGEWIAYHKNGQISKKGSFNKSGNEIGIWYEYYPDGKKHSITEYDKKGQHKKTQEFHENGEIIGLAIDGKNIGTWKSYNFATKKLSSIANYNDLGELHGMQKYFSKNGQLYSESSYVNGVKD